jgi:aryl-alcohol dehydrogenase-like predicted oxidoreductase
MMNNISSKLSLGTVQFGIKYGVNNTNGIPDDSGLKDILNLAHTAGIDILDCAPGYGISEKRIGLNALGRFKIITKFSNVESEANFKTALQSSLETLRIKQAYGYIAHNCDELIANPETWEWLQNAKNEGKIQKAGFSLYHTEQLERLMELNMIPDLVQLPYNLLDKKFDSYLIKLKYFGTEIHVRSVFLQGLFFMDIEKIKSNLKPLVPQLKELMSR